MCWGLMMQETGAPAPPQPPPMMKCCHRQNQSNQPSNQPNLNLLQGLVHQAPVQLGGESPATTTPRLSASTISRPSLLTSSYLLHSAKKRRRRRLEFSSSDSSEDEEDVDDPTPLATPLPPPTRGGRQRRGGRVRRTRDVDIRSGDPHGFSGAVVKTLMDKHFKQNHILYTDNYYTSPALTQYLLQEETGTCGTVRKFRKHWPAFPDTQERGTVKKKECGPMLALQWVDKRPVNILTTVHTGDLQDSGKVDHHTQEPVKKPDAVIDYNINMRLVDKSDMMLTQNTSLSLRLLERQIISQLFEKFGTILPRIGAVRDVNDRMAAAEYMAAHKLVLNPLRPSGRAGFNKCQVCMYTSRRDKKRTETKYRCAACNVALCPVNCFAEFHSLENY
ncbi:hypothetical protein O3P69_011740 [Scylla paramamosain]|uniref:PiggyBac transposable element-derived protein domain-containing protein n=1 Tax=Scylla paramamosain TaxID=85552 RepID=A0AAW0SEV5_SCYPA